MLIAIYLLAVASIVSAGGVRPTISLPWGTWEAEKHKIEGKIYKFHNVRFGAEPPRFGLPDFPSTHNTSLQDSNYGPSCHQVDTTTQKHPPGGRPEVLFPGDETVDQSEDCLFLDVYAPAHNFDEHGRPKKKLPVIVWFYGGAYAFGSKELGGGLPLYTGQSMIAAHGDYDVVFVAGNYRLGAFGWLAGHYMESEAQPNAGLYDQALLLNWTQQYIAQAGGDPSHVSAWGESAGAGSIMHHLIREGGTKDPLFQSFLVQSPAFEWAWDNAEGGTLDHIYKNFSILAGCEDKFNITCLQDQKAHKLVKANQELFDNVHQTGLFPVGPSVDGKWIKTLPATSFAKNQTWPKINSALISHVYNESASFTPHYVNSQEKFDYFLGLMFPEKPLGNVRDAIRSQYNCTAKYQGDFQTCVATLIRDSTFTCNTRQLFNSYPDISYMMRYSFWSEATAAHATDLIPTFMNSEKDAYNILIANNQTPFDATVYALDLNSFVKSWYQDYLNSFAVYGNPNTRKKWDVQHWPLATNGQEVSDVLEIHGKMWTRLISDDQNSSPICDFWTKMANFIEGINTVGDVDLGWIDGYPEEEILEL